MEQISSGSSDLPKEFFDYIDLNFEPPESYSDIVDAQTGGLNFTFFIKVYECALMWRDKLLKNRREILVKERRELLTKQDPETQKLYI